jgi:glucose-fructose oxidoreductase
MATTQEDCEAMMRAAAENSVKLMIAYRLHFNDANLHAIRVAQSGDLGEPRYFGSLFGLQVKEGNIRTRKTLGAVPCSTSGFIASTPRATSFATNRSKSSG